jgi:hypothetical protein
MSTRGAHSVCLMCLGAHGMKAEAEAVDGADRGGQRSGSGSEHVRCMLAAKPSTMPYLEHEKNEQQKRE